MLAHVKDKMEPVLYFKKKTLNLLTGKSNRCSAVAFKYFLVAFVLVSSKHVFLMKFLEHQTLHLQNKFYRIYKNILR